jgi:hypothetical protein
VAALKFDRFDEKDIDFYSVDCYRSVDEFFLTEGSRFEVLT